MTRENLLQIFETNKGKTLSGSELAKTLNVSRNAVWKAIEVLRKEGYDIVSVKNKGYMLLENSDILSEFKIRSALCEELKDIPLHIFKTIDSTNLYLNRLAADKADEWCVCACEEQTHGSRRNLSAFPSPSGKGVYMSVLLRPDFSLESIGKIPVLAAKSTAAAIKELCGINTVISDGADLYFGDKKLCGILSDAMVECATSKIRHISVGIGVRVYGAAESGEISIYDITSEYCNRSELIAKILSFMYKNYLSSDFDT